MREALPEYTPPQYFDTLTGDVLIGDAAVSAHIENGGNPSDILPIGELICEKKIQLSSGTYPHIDAHRMTREDHIVAGRKLLSLLPEWHSSPNTINSTVITRASVLGLSAGLAAICSKRNFGSIPNYNRALGLEPNYKRGEFDSWSIQQIVDYVGTVIKDLPRHISVDDILNDLARRDKGPSGKVIAKRVGSLSHAINLAGYVESRTWEEQDYIDWGVKFMFANGDKVPSTPAIKLLYSRRRAPGRHSISARFGSLTKYQARVATEYEFEKEHRESVRKNKISEIDRAIASGQFPVELAKQATSEDELIKLYAKYMLLLRLLPEFPPNDLRQRALIKNPDRLVKSIQGINPIITSAQIETEAETIGVFGDIWEFDAYKQHLKVAA